MPLYVSLCIGYATHSIATYPTGLLWEFDENQLGKNDQATRIELALGGAPISAPLRTSLEPGNKLLYALAVTHVDDPTFDDWIWTMRNLEKVGWCAANNRPYVVLWLRISRVADYFQFSYNHWNPRGATGFMDADHRIEPNDAWKQYESVICSRLHTQGFVLATNEMLRERIACVVEESYDEIPEDDPCWDEEDFKPPLVQASVYQCLFGGD